jgi:hypothetical protein
MKLPPTLAEVWAESHHGPFDPARRAFFPRALRAGGALFPADAALSGSTA